MQRNERNPVVEHLNRAFAAAWRHISWAAEVPAALLRRSRGSIVDAGGAAERAKFDSRTWTAELLKHIEWRRFEELCRAYFEATGFTTSIGQSRADGGVDICLSSAASTSPSVLVHCKAWDAYRVGIKPVRELREAMALASIGNAILVTPGRFTQEAVALAAKEKIELIDGAALLGKLVDMPPEQSLALLKLARQGDFLTPTCPCCSVKMTSRKSTQGGRKFWGCINYPRCKQTFSGTAPA
jgi:restriction system protein